MHPSVYLMFASSILIVLINLVPLVRWLLKLLATRSEWDWYFKLGGCSAPVKLSYTAFRGSFKTKDFSFSNFGQAFSVLLLTKNSAIYRHGNVSRASSVDLIIHTRVIVVHIIVPTDLIGQTLKRFCLAGAFGATLTLIDKQVIQLGPGRIQNKFDAK